MSPSDPSPTSPPSSSAAATPPSTASPAEAEPTPGPSGRRALDALREVVEQRSTWSDRVWDALVGRVRNNPVPWAVAALAMVAIGSAVVMVVGHGPVGRRSSGGGPAVSLVTGSAHSSDPAEGTASPTTIAALVVQVAGAVSHPGVYHLPSGSRVGDLVRAAGGFATDADGDRVNQAAALADGTLIYIPHQGQTDLPDPVDGGGTGPAGAVGAPVDLNTATAAQLDALPGVGPATAAAIITYRRQHGPFHQVGDLAQVAGIGPAKLAQIRPHARVWTGIRVPGAPACAGGPCPTVRCWP